MNNLETIINWVDENIENLLFAFSAATIIVVFFILSILVGYYFFKEEIKDIEGTKNDESERL